MLVVVGDGVYVKLNTTLSLEWSPSTLCEAYAKQRGFHMRGGKFDIHRAANLMLRDTLNGKKAVLSFPPPTQDSAASGTLEGS